MLSATSICGSKLVTSLLWYMHSVYGSVYLYGYVSIHICYACSRRMKDYSYFYSFFFPVKPCPVTNRGSTCDRFVVFIYCKLVLGFVVISLKNF